MGGGGGHLLYLIPSRDQKLISINYQLPLQVLVDTYCSHGKKYVKKTTKTCLYRSFRSTRCSCAPIAAYKRRHQEVCNCNVYLQEEYSVFQWYRAMEQCEKEDKLEEQKSCRLLSRLPFLFIIIILRVDTCPEHQK